MDASRFDAWARSFVRSSSRRSVLGGLAGALPAVTGLPWTAAAKKKNKKKKKPKIGVFKQFGCLDVGQPCGGRGDLCCSGVCAGQKPKKGKPDKRTCAEHNARGCSPPRSACVTSSVVLSLCNPPDVQAVCLTTTGNAGFCATALGFDPALHCQSCTKDADCLPLGFAPGSACVIFQGGVCADPCAATGGRACFPPAVFE